jgi:ubiquinone/menaquinone biosynthesis C-methylase UbiE
MAGEDYFNQVASQWDSMRQSFFSDSVRDKALALAGVIKGKTAADIGAGSGFISEALIAAGLKVVAVDQSPAMIALMREKFAGVPGVEYRVGEAESLPIADASVDYAFANMYLHHVEVPLAGIREMVRILKPGGRLVITDLDSHDFEFLATEHHDRWLGFDREDIRKWFAEAGLSEVVVEDIQERCTSDSESGAETASISIFAASGTRQ